MLINPNLKIHEYYIEPTITNSKKNEIYEYLVQRNQELMSINSNMTNFEILSHYDYFDNLYDTFLETAKSMFTNITITEPNKKCWALVTSVNDKKPNLWHDHSRSSSINGVFYFSVPDENSGKLLFGDGSNVTFEYQPKENFMLIFPNDLLHCPTHCESEKYRIAINLELKCLENIW